MRLDPAAGWCHRDSHDRDVAVCRWRRVPLHRQARQGTRPRAEALRLRPSPDRRIDLGGHLRPRPQTSPGSRRRVGRTASPAAGSPGVRRPQPQRRPHHTRRSRRRRSPLLPGPAESPGTSRFRSDHSMAGRPASRRPGWDGARRTAAIRLPTIGRRGSRAGSAPPRSRAGAAPRPTRAVVGWSERRGDDGASPSRAPPIVSHVRGSREPLHRPTERRGGTPDSRTPPHPSPLRSRGGGARNPDESPGVDTPTATDRQAVALPIGACRHAFRRRAEPQRSYWGHSASAREASHSLRRVRLAGARRTPRRLATRVSR